MGHVPVKITAMLTNSQLSKYFEEGQFLAAAAALPSSAARLSQGYFNHPIFALLRKIEPSARLLKSAVQYAADGALTLWPPAQDILAAKQVLADAAAALGAMFALPPGESLRQGFVLTAKQIVSLDKEQVSSLTFGSYRGRYSPAATLLENIVSLAWFDGLEVFILNAPSISSYDLGKAILAAADNHQQAMLEKLFEVYHKLHGNDPIGEPLGYEMASSILRMDNITGECLSMFMASLSVDSVGCALRYGTNSDVLAKNVLSWFTAKPGDWVPLHNSFKALHEKELSVRSSIQPLVYSAWMHLLRGLGSVPDGHLHPVLRAALSAPDASWWMNTAVYDTGKARLTPASALVQGQTKTLLSEYPPPHGIRFAKTRRKLRLLQALSGAGAKLRVGQWLLAEGMTSLELSTTELIDWSKQGLSPTRAFLHRHPQWAMPNQENGRSALFTASTPKVFTALQTAGLDPSLPDKLGHYATALQLHRAVLSGKASPIKAWGAICAESIKSGLTPLDATTGQAKLPLLACSSPGLIRTWLKCSGAPPSPEQVSEVMEHSSYAVILGWLKAGVFDHDEKLQEALLEAARAKLEKSSTETHARRAKFSDLCAALSSRPTQPWPVARQSWKRLWTLTISEHQRLEDFHRAKIMDNNSGNLAGLEKLTRIFSNWMHPDGKLQAHDILVLKHVASNSPMLLENAIPPSTNPHCRTELFWGIVLSPARYSFVSAERLLRSAALSSDLGLSALLPFEIEQKLAALKLAAAPHAVHHQDSTAYVCATVEAAAMEYLVPAAKTYARRRI
jgi:hypothetical protein